MVCFCLESWFTIRLCEVTKPWSKTHSWKGWRAGTDHSYRVNCQEMVNAAGCRTCWMSSGDGAGLGESFKVSQPWGFRLCAVDCQPANIYCREKEKHLERWHWWIKNPVSAAPSLTICLVKTRLFVTCPVGGRLHPGRNLPLPQIC